MLDRIAPALKQYLNKPWFIASVFGLSICFVIRAQNNFAINQMIGVQEAVSSSIPLISIGSTVVLLAYCLYLYLKKDEPSPFFFKGHSMRCYLVALVAIMAFGALVLCNFGIISNKVVLICGKIFVGVANSLLIIVWVEFFIYLGREAMIMGLCASLVLSAAFQLLMAIIYSNANFLILMVLPLISCMLYDRAVTLQKDTEESSGNTQMNTGKEPRFTGPVLFFMSIIAYHFLATTLRVLWIQSYAVSTNSGIFQVSSAIGIAMAGVVVYYALMFKEEECSIIYSLIVAILLVCAFYLSALLEGYGIIGYVIPLYIAYWLIFFVVWEYAFGQRKLHSRLAYVVCGLLAIEVGKILNLEISLLAESSQISSKVVYILITVTLLFMLFKELVSLFVWQKRQIARAETALAAPRSTGSFRQACESLCKDFKLTPREVEIFMYMARGRNTEYIASKLYIENVSVKSHVTRMYRKLGISSHQQLIDLVEERMADSASGE